MKRGVLGHLLGQREREDRRAGAALFIGGVRSVTVAPGRSDVILSGVREPERVAREVFSLMKTREAVDLETPDSRQSPAGGRG